jgi:hypothetical protein
MAIFPNPPSAVAGANAPPGQGGFGPRTVSFTTPTGGLSGSPTDGMTLDALMARQKALQTQAAQPLPDKIPSPWQGASQLVGTLGNLLQQRTAATEEAQGRQAIAEAMTHRDPATGELTPEAQATVMQLMPTLGSELYKTALDARERMAEIKAQQTTWAADPNHPGQQISSLGEVRNIPGVVHMMTPEERAKIPGIGTDPFYVDEHGVPQPLLPRGETEYRENQLAQAHVDVMNNETAQSRLNEALGYLNDGINTGMLTGGAKLASNIPVVGGVVDKDTVDRTTKFNDIFSDPTMQSAMAAGMVGIPQDEVAAFLRTMASPGNDINVKRDAVNHMRDRLQLIHDEQMRHTQFLQAQTGRPDTMPQQQKTQTDTGADAPELPGVKEKAVQDTMTATGWTRDKVIAKLKARQQQAAGGQ